MHLILASQSIGRKKLLEHINIPFTVIPSNIDEDKIIAQTPLATLKLRTRMKGENIAKRISSQESETIGKIPISIINDNLHSFFILSADSGAILDGELIGKPKNYDMAVKILKKLSGKTHQFVTAISITKLQFSKKLLAPSTQTPLSHLYDQSFVTFRKLTNEDINIYLSILNYTKYAGSYALDSGQTFITNIKGSLSNVIGLPLEKVLPIFRKNNL